MIVMSHILEAALEYFKMGFSVIPLKRDKRPYTTWEKWQLVERANEKQIKEWWQNLPEANVGVSAPGRSAA